MSSNHASLDAAAVERKARLAKLASLKRKQPESEAQPEKDEDAPSKTQSRTDGYLSGRNYDIETRGPKLGFENVPTSGQTTLEEQAAAIASKTAEQARRDEEEAEKGIDLFKLQPKKPNWDLKRDLDEKMKVLNVRTQNAIARLVRERIQDAKQEAQSKSKGVAEHQDKGGEGEEVGIEGTTLVEGVHLRERQEQEDERKELEMDEEDGVA